MEIVGAAALIAVGIVVAAALYSRSHGSATVPATIADLDATTALQAALTERGSALDRREDGLARREGALSAPGGGAGLGAESGAADVAISGVVALAAESARWPYGELCWPADWP